MVGSAVPQPSAFPFPVSGVGPKPAHLITTAAALRLGDFLHHRFIGLRCHLGFLLQPAFKGKSPLGDVPGLKNLWHERALQFERINLLEWASRDAWSYCFYFFNGEETRNDFGGKGMSNLPMSRRGTFNGRWWTNILLAINVLVYMAQIATKGKLMLAGAKINSLIDKGELWRLITSSFLHANIGHLMVNCYSLNSVGPTVEKISGPRRYLAVYITSAIASSAMSYWLCKAPAVGASGAIFGLVGSFAVFILRHRNLVKDGNGDLHHILCVIFLNMVFGLMSKGIDNWGHLGGLVGGAATSWLLGPAWRYESPTNDGRRVFSDRAPIFSIVNGKETSRWYR